MPTRRTPSSPRVVAVEDSVSMDLFDQPGHLIRRAHQIAQGMFSDHVGPAITPSQFAILRMVHEMPAVDQVSLARRIGLDTSSAALTAARLESRGMLTRVVAEHDRRLLRLTLTPEGEALLESTVSGVHHMREKLLESLEPAERELFMTLLRKFVHINNKESRAPMRSLHMDETQAPETPTTPTAPKASKAPAAKVARRNSNAAAPSKPRAS